ncbi:MAG: aldehyde dehydrogenase family protein [Deltaproteobacteria bacterium]|nr:aldehyde dehydrogenase family protein [Deltaproteobacteria bacterium]
MTYGKNREDEIRRYGARIYSLMGAEAPSLFRMSRWRGRLLEWAMRDEAFKAQLFRFIDVLPCLKSDDQVPVLLREYLEEARGGSVALKQGLDRILRLSDFTGLAGPLIRAGVESIAGEFILGRDAHDGWNSLNRLHADGLAFSLDLLGEEVVSEKEARQLVDRHLELIASLAPRVVAWPENPILDRDNQGPIPRWDLSLKVSSFYSQLDSIDWEGAIEHAIHAALPVLDAAQKAGASITLDMERYELKNLTIALFKRIVEERPKFAFIGLALQAYLTDTKDDLIGIIQWARRNQRRVTVRLVKGAYWDYETVVNRRRGWPIPVFRGKEKTDLSYEELTRVLLENGDAARPAFGTHNVRSISSALAVAESLGLPPEAFEFQMIYGMAEPVRKALQRMGYRIRVYAPLGELIPGMGYLIRRLLENTSNESFLRKSFFEKTPFDELMKPPAPHEDKMQQTAPQDGFTNDPPVDFSRTENRRAMTAALTKVKDRFPEKCPLLVGSEEVWTDDKIFSRNPALPDEVVGVAGSANRSHVEKAVEQARSSWEVWRRTPVSERAAYLIEASQEMAARRFDLMALEVYEVGKTWREADGDVAEAIDYLRFYASEMIRLGTPMRLGSYPGEENLYFYEPQGVGVVISPWNFPLAIPTGMVSAALVAGNCVILKPSGLAPILGWQLVEIFRRVGLPDGVLQFLTGPGHEVGEALVSHSGIDFVVFTGSKNVGLRIVQLAGETLPGQRNVKRVIAEMGGKNAIIIDETADLDEAVKGVLQSALSFQGQKCSACSRVIVVGERFDEFAGRLGDAMESLHIGPPESPENAMGPVVNEAAFDKIKKAIEQARTEGRMLLAREVNGPGYFVGPALVADVDADSHTAQEEIFGPVVALMRASDIDAAIELANRTRYALTGGIFSRSPAHVRKACREFRVGNLYINRGITGALVGRQPFGGFGISGVGSKAGGPDYLLQFMHPRSISENTLRRGFAPEFTK